MISEAVYRIAFFVLLLALLAMAQHLEMLDSQENNLCPKQLL